MKIDQILDKEPFSLNQIEKNRFFMLAMREAVSWHYDNCVLYKKFIDSQNFNINSDFPIEELPYLSVSLFKELDLISVPENQIITTLLSSATSSGKPSRIALDKITSLRQQKALQKIMQSYLGKKRNDFLIFDSITTVKKTAGQTHSRASAIRGMTAFAKSMNFVLNDQLKLEKRLLSQAKEKSKGSETMVFFGFTWLIYQLLNNLNFSANRETLDLMKTLAENGKLLHIGGWKKLSEKGVTKQDFNKLVGNTLNIKKSNIIDLYGMTEQLGTVYPDCEAGYKHLPLYTELIVRDPESLEALPVGSSGLIQLISPLPHSYPGISIIADDIVKYEGVDDCICGRKGKYFSFEKRVEKAPLKGCGDTIL